MGSAASRSQGMLMFDNIDPEGEYAVELGPPAGSPAQAGPVAAAAAPGPVQAGFVPAQADGANEEGLEDAPEDESDDEEALDEYLEVHEGVQDIRCEDETLVINTSQTRIMPDQAEASAEVHSGILDQSSDMLQLMNNRGKKYTATFSTPPQPTNTVVPIGRRLAAPGLEAVPETQTAARGLEKAPIESVEERALKGKAGEKDPGAAPINQAGPGPGPSASGY